jgi:hypothetical protein
MTVFSGVLIAPPFAWLRTAGFVLPNGLITKFPNISFGEAKHDAWTLAYDLL